MSRNFTNESVIIHFFSNPWPLLLPDLTPSDFWFCGHLKNLVYRGDVATLDDLENSIKLHVRSITTDQLRSYVKHIVHRLETLQVTDGGLIEHLSLHRSAQD
ncbi:hypothetical protein AVEN_138565-1 [Araneus ventricosus]|uniref:Uncharacterized protein n=1 Tax=Araneus ventricosus TaxID=182803 RepID=A0A4Y2Q127_ARAVE|nr:hypothetical protein AVEN_138565-1 [Araneus ventricosus]